MFVSFGIRKNHTERPWCLRRVTQTARKEEIPSTDEATSPAESKPKSQGSKGKQDLLLHGEPA